MKEIKENLWNIAHQYDAICITTNGFVKSNGEAVMGRGIALQAAKKYPELPRILGKEIKIWGNIPRILSYTGQFIITSFPVKHNWNEKADISLIVKSAQYMMDMADQYRWNKILLPKPGCGNGQLDWDSDVKFHLESILDSRFTIIGY